MSNLSTDAIEECIGSYEETDSDTGGSSFGIEASAQLSALKAEVEDGMKSRRDLTKALVTVMDYLDECLKVKQQCMSEISDVLAHSDALTNLNRVISKWKTK